MNFCSYHSFEYFHLMKKYENIMVSDVSAISAIDKRQSNSVCYAIVAIVLLLHTQLFNLYKKNSSLRRIIKHIEILKSELT